ncbi:MAG: VanW family protein [Candidatus Peribacteraceae bacterium]|nr:VanW family protein [Candidatus Peribacteraceae bacterium]MDD5742803.1 VanW family protein [Candidatus Peribacteraceae bacterium]
MRRFAIFISLLLGAFFPSVASAASLTYRYQHHLFTIAVGKEWQEPKEVWTYEGQPAKVPAIFRVDGDHVPALPSGFARSEVTTWNHDAIRAALKQQIAAVFDRPPGSVVMRGGTGSITFEGVGLPGRRVDLERAVTLTVSALEAGITDITLPVIETQPAITVQDPTLATQGIREVVSIGESDFSGSTGARRHNIQVGLAKFNGVLVPQGAAFSFDETLGPVNAATGYLKELVIMGDKTLPDYGGGLCQVGTTFYRGVWEYGFPILARRNHSFAVHYYSPQGTDATIYPPYTDIKFLNDSPGALLIQTFVENDHAYFIYYGTRDDRQSEVIGPYTWGYAAPPPDKIEYTTEIPAGTTRKVGERVPGMKAMWWRLVSRGDTETEESVYSVYEARPRFDQIGVEATSSLLLPSSGSSTSAASVPSSRSR